MAAVALSILPVVGRAEGWPTTEWQVYCYRPTCEQWYGDGRCASNESTFEWSGYDQELLLTSEVWEGRKECSDQGGPTAAKVTKLLHEASVWLQTQGFNAPLLPRHPKSGKFLAFVAPPSWAVSVYGAGPTENEAGIAVPRPFYLPPIEGREDLPFRTLIILEPNRKDIAHELFHAIQYNSPAWRGGFESVASWIEEGTAEAIGLTFDGRDQVGNRPYDEILNWKPPSEDQAYQDQFFWRRVGERIGSQPKTAYLKNLLNGNLEVKRGLDGVDTVLKPYGRLYAQLPVFFANLDAGAEFFGPPQKYTAELPSGKDRETRQFPNSQVKMVAGRSGELEITHSSDKPVEVEISFVEDHPDLHLIVDGNIYDHLALGSNLYRGVLPDQQRATYDLVIASVAKKAVDSKDRDYQLQVKLREVSYCTMTARITGDVSGSYFGDGAYFNTFDNGTVMATGSGADPEMVEMMGDMMEAWGEMAEEMGQAGTGEGAKAMRQSWDEWNAQGQAEGNETFGLSLIDIKLDSDNPMSGLATLMGGFTLEAAANGPEMNSEGYTGSVPLSRLRVVPGASDDSGDKVPFLWAKGEPGSAHIEITHNTGDLIAGRVSGTLYTEHTYSSQDRKLMIQVEATFVALEGALSCSTGGAF